MCVLACMPKPFWHYLTRRHSGDSRYIGCLEIYRTDCGSTSSGESLLVGELIPLTAMADAMVEDDSVVDQAGTATCNSDYSLSAGYNNLNIGLKRSQYVTTSAAIAASLKLDKLVFEGAKLSSFDNGCFFHCRLSRRSVLIVVHPPRMEVCANSIVIGADHQPAAATRCCCCLTRVARSCTCLIEAW